MLEFRGPRGQLPQLAVRRGELLLEHLVVEVLDVGADVTPGVEAPPLCLDLLDRRNPAQAATST